MPRVHTVEKARKAQPQYGIKKGDKYYWWKFRYGGKRVSKTYPKRSQLTQSDYLSQIYDLEDEIGTMSASDADDLQSQRDDIVSRLEELRDEQEEKRNNMPEQLQEASVGELLQERYDALDNAISELDGIDLDYDEPSDKDLREEAIEELQLDEDDEESLQDQETEINDAMERIKEEKLTEWIDEKIGEIRDVSFE